MAITINYKMRDPAVHPEDTRELAPMYDEMQLGNYVTAAYVGLLPEGGTEPVRVQFRTVQTDPSTPPLGAIDSSTGKFMETGPNYVISYPGDLLPFSHLWQIIGASDSEEIWVKDLQGNDVTLVVTRYEESAT